MGAMIVIVVLCVVGLLFMKVAPTYLEARAIDTAILKARNGATSDADVRRAYGRLMGVDDIKSVNPSDLVVTKDGDTLIVSYAYSAKIGLVGTASLVIDYAGSTKGR